VQTSQLDKEDAAYLKNEWRHAQVAISFVLSAVALCAHKIAHFRHENQKRLESYPSCFRWRSGLVWNDDNAEHDGHQDDHGKGSHAHKGKHSHGDLEEKQATEDDNTTDRSSVSHTAVATKDHHDDGDDEDGSHAIRSSFHFKPNFKTREDKYVYAVSHGWENTKDVPAYQEKILYCKRRRTICSDLSDGVLSLFAAIIGFLAAIAANSSSEQERYALTVAGLVFAAAMAVWKVAMNFVDAYYTAEIAWIERNFKGFEWPLNDIAYRRWAVRHGKVAEAVALKGVAKEPALAVEASGSDAHV
jgi:hypothetical protein